MQEKLENMTYSQEKHQSIEMNKHRNETDDRMNRQGYIHLVILNIFHLFKDVEEKHAHNEGRNKRN